MPENKRMGEVALSQGNIVDLEVLVDRLDRIIRGSNSKGIQDAGVQSVDCLAPGGRYTRVPPVFVDADDIHPAMKVYANYVKSSVQEFGSLNRVELRDAYVTGHGAVVTRDFRLIEESSWEFLYNKMTPNGLAQTAPQKFRFAANVSKKIEKQSLLVKRPWWRNYGHWLVDGAALLAVSSALSFSDEWQIVIGKHEDGKMHDIVRETISIIAPGIPVVEHPDSEIWQFDRLHYVTPVHRPPLFKLPQALAALRALVVASDLSNKSHKRIYISRGDAPRRRLQNEAEILEFLQERGFEVVRPELLSLKEQASLFRSAEIIVGVKGAALTNSIFCGTSTALIVLSPIDWPDPFFMDIACQLGLSYAEIFGCLAPIELGLGTGQNPFTIKLDLLKRAINDVCARTEREKNLERFNASNGKPFKLVDAATLSISSRQQTNLHLPDLTGEFYHSTLARLHNALQPRSYLEIGTVDEHTLKLARCASIAVGPKIQHASQIPTKPMPALCLFPMTSDEFFESYNPKNILGMPIDVAFLDSVHLLECLLRDFIHTEMACDNESVIVLHNCVPLDLYMAVRDEADFDWRALSTHPEWWTGDLWKIIPILREYRPDLAVRIFNARPTGLVMIRGLNPNSRVLSDSYDEIIAKFCGSTDDTILFAEHASTLELYDTASVTEGLTRFRWV